MTEIIINPYTGTGEPQFKVTTTTEHGTQVWFYKTMERAAKAIGSSKAHGWQAVVVPTTDEEKKTYKGGHRIRL
jgi:hypothetical protein